MHFEYIDVEVLVTLGKNHYGMTTVRKGIREKSYYNTPTFVRGTIMFLPIPYLKINKSSTFNIIYTVYK